MNAEDIRFGVQARLPVGADHAVSATSLAHQIGCTERAIGIAVAELIEDGYCIGSRCGEGSGYFQVATAEDLEIGVGHIVRRAAASFRRVRALRKSYERMPGHEQTNIFDLFPEQKWDLNAAIAHAADVIEDFRAPPYDPDDIAMITGFHK